MIYDIVKEDGKEKSMLTLGIESSCDETALALVYDGKMVAQSLYSQAKLHALFGGVVPELASRQHYTALSHCMEELLSQVPYTMEDIDCIAVARGPGLLGSLLVGIAFAKGLAFTLQKPLVGVNHLHAHLFAAGLEYPLSFPFIGILISGGHTYIYYCSSYTECTILGRTLDDAVGEVFDKIGKMLGMEYPAGRRIEEFALKAQSDTVFTHPYCKVKTIDCSFSGLKTQVLQYIQKHPECILKHHRTTPEENPYCAYVCASITRTIAETLTHKVILALEHCNENKLPYSALVLGGGVAANQYIRHALRECSETYMCPLYTPSLSLCTDNAYMIAYLGQQLYKSGYYHSSSLSAIPRGSIVPVDYLKM